MSAVSEVLKEQDTEIELLTVLVKILARVDQINPIAREPGLPELSVAIKKTALLFREFYESYGCRTQERKDVMSIVSVLELLLGAGDAEPTGIFQEKEKL